MDEWIDGFLVVVFGLLLLLLPQDKGLATKTNIPYGCEMGRMMMMMMRGEEEARLSVSLSIYLSHSLPPSIPCPN